MTSLEGPSRYSADLAEVWNTREPPYAFQAVDDSVDGWDPKVDG